jgi:hypothetical protein
MGHSFSGWEMAVIYIATVTDGFDDQPVVVAIPRDDSTVIQLYHR